jgi:Ca2+-binding EF-hand superfamily protein
VAKYVRIIFKMLEHDNTGYVKCGQFLQFISVVARGDARERVELCFNLLDLSKEGVLKKQDFKQVRTSLCKQKSGTNLQQNLSFTKR